MGRKLKWGAVQRQSDDGLRKCVGTWKADGGSRRRTVWQRRQRTGGRGGTDWNAQGSQPKAAQIQEGVALVREGLQKLLVDE